MDANHSRRMTIAVVLASALSAAAIGYQNFPRWPELWHDPVHDRNAHLEGGFGAAVDLAHGRPGGLLSAIDRARTWPPLHDVLLVGATTLAGGGDPRWAVLPSLLSLVGAAAFAALAAQRMTGEEVAGYVAALFVLASPALRAYSFDVMLEGPGACLTLALLAAWLGARQAESPAAWRWLALALSALFFVKYNYWLLGLLAILATEWHKSLPYVPMAMRGLAADAGPWLRRQWRHPLNYLIVAIAGLIAWVRYAGGGELVLFGQSIPLRTNANLGTLLYWVVVLRALPWWWRTGRALVTRDARVAAVVRWHVLPVAVWFLWPQKLASFLWVINPGDNVGEFPVTDRWGGYPYYVQAIQTDYHWAVGAFVVAAVFAAVGLVALLLRRLRPGSAAVFALLAIALVLAAHHPNRKSRFLHSWLPAMWVAAGAGVGAVAAVRPPISRRLSVLGTAGVALAQLPAYWSPGGAPEGGVPAVAKPTLFRLTDAYLPLLGQAERPAVLSNVPLKFLARWTYLERYGRAVRPVTEVPGFDAARRGPGNGELFLRWLATTNCDAIVLVQLPQDSPWYVPVPGCGGMEQFAELLPAQQRFEKRATAEPAVTVWVRTGRE